MRAQRPARGQDTVRALGSLVLAAGSGFRAWGSRTRRKGDPAAAAPSCWRLHGPPLGEAGRDSARGDSGEGRGRAGPLCSARGRAARARETRPRRGADAAGDSGAERGARAAAERRRREAGPARPRCHPGRCEPGTLGEPRRAQGARPPRPPACVARRAFCSRPWAEAAAASSGDMHLPGAA